MLNELRERVVELSEYFNSIKKDIENIKKNQLEMKDTLVKTKNNSHSSIVE